MIFSGYHVLGVSSFSYISPLRFLAIRFCIATLVLGALALVIEAKGSLRAMFPAEPRTLKIILCGGFLGFFVSAAAFILGLSESSASIGGIFQPLIAVFSAGLATLLKLEKMTPPKAAGIGSAALGVLVIVAGPIVWEGQPATTSAFAVILFLGAASLLFHCLALTHCTL